MTDSQTTVSERAAVPASMRGGKGAVIALLGILLFTLAVRLTLIDRPMHRDPEGYASFYGMLARNYFRYDWRKTLGVPVQNLSRNPDVPLRYYGNHPPLITMLTAGVYAMFGYRGSGTILPPDWQLRLLPTIFTLACIVVLYATVSRAVCPRAGVLAAFAFAAMPITLYYGGHVDVINSQLLFFVLLSVIAYLRLHETPTIRIFALTAIPLALAGLTDWVAFYLLPIFAVHWAVTKPLRSWGWMIALGVVGIVTFAVAYIPAAIVERDALWIRSVLAHRTINAESDQGTRITPTGWVRSVVARNVRLHTIPVLILALGWIASRGWKFRLHQDRASRIARLLLAWAALHAMIGLQGVFSHDWWWWPLTPGLAIATALAVESLWRAAQNRGIAARPILASVVIVCAIFATYNAQVTIRRLHNPGLFNAGRNAYTIAELGDAVRNAAGPGQTVLLVDDETCLSLWYYGDRPLIRNVWDRARLDKCLAHPGETELPFGFVEQTSSPAVAVVFPKANASRAAELLDHLRAKYPVIDSQKFYIFVGK